MSKNKAIIIPSLFGFIEENNKKNVYVSDSYGTWRWVLNAGPDKVHVISTKQGLIKFMGKIKDEKTAEVILEALGIK